MGVSDRRLHVQLTQEAKNASDFSLIRAIFAFAGFVSALAPGFLWSRRFSCGVVWESAWPGETLHNVCHH